MTALAMMIGMLPLALSEEQNAPLGRAVLVSVLAIIADLLLQWLQRSLTPKGLLK